MCNKLNVMFIFYVFLYLTNVNFMELILQQYKITQILEILKALVSNFNLFYNKLFYFGYYVIDSIKLFNRWMVEIYPKQSEQF